MDKGVKILNIKAGRDVAKQKKSRRYKSGPKKGELMTPSDESIDELMINTSSWSDSSDEPVELRGKVVPIKALAPGPRDESDHEYDEKELRMSNIMSINYVSDE